MPPPPTHDPRLIFTGGPTFGVDRPDPCVAVTGNRISAVGGLDVLDLAGPRTEVVDLHGGLLLPGFTDAHVHPVQAGMERLACDLSGQRSREGCLEAIGTYARSRPDLEWIVGGGWSMESFPGGTPTAVDLDSAVADRPVLLLNRDHHGAWANSTALRLAGIDATTADPADGRIERDADDVPTGTLHEGAMAMVHRLLPATTVDDQVAGLLEAQRHLHSLGITGWQDAIIGDYANLADASAAYLEASAAGTLTARVVGALWWRRDRGVEQVHELIERRDALQTSRFRANTVKIMVDGVAENFTAAMTAPYLDAEGCPSNNSGLSFVPRDELVEAVMALDSAGFQVHVHAIGDRAVRDSLDAFERARKANGDSDLRHHIAHIQVIHPDDVPRFGALGVAANMQPLWAVHEPQMDELTIPFLGDERATWQYPFVSLAVCGARLVAGSDWPVSSPDPLWGVHVAVNRMAPPQGRGGESLPFLPAQRLDVTTALRAYTDGSAWINHLDDAGRIEVGCLADFAVLDRDLLSLPNEEISSARVVATYVDGQRVH